jgi:hypothetical protein
MLLKIAVGSSSGSSSTLIQPGQHRYRTRPIDVRCTERTVPAGRRGVMLLMLVPPIWIRRDVAAAADNVRDVTAGPRGGWSVGRTGIG